MSSSSLADGKSEQDQTAVVTIFIAARDAPGLLGLLSNNISRSTLIKIVCHGLV